MTIRTFPWRPLGWGAAIALLLIPFVAMQFTREVNWTALDFVTVGAMLLLAGGALELLVRSGDGIAYRLGAGLTVLGCFLLIWINLAVGIIGSEQNDANMMYAAVIAILVGGAMVVRARAAGMARVLTATAAAQVLIGAIALVGDLGGDGPVWPRDVIGLTVIFAGWWLVAAALFARASRR